MTLALDDVRSKRREQRRQDRRWQASAAVEREYAARLRIIARHIDELVRAWARDGALTGADVEALSRQLNNYAAVLEPWARAAAERMLAAVDRRNFGAWMTHSRRIAAGLRQEVFETPIGEVMRASLDRQVALITSLPIEAAERAQRLALGEYIAGNRIGEIRSLGPQARGPLTALPEGLAKEILKTGNVTASRANLIARTSVSTASTELTKARAEFVGSPGYFWRSAGDADVRLRHKVLNGKFIRWDDPPIAGEKGERYHAGSGPNCRCFPSPVLPDEDVS